MMPKNCQCGSQGQGLELWGRGQSHRSQGQGHKNLASRCLKVKAWPWGGL